MSAQPETVRRRTVHASDKLASNAERLLWRAHQRAAQMLDEEPGPVAQTVFAAVHAEWRRAYLERA